MNQVLHIVNDEMQKLHSLAERVKWLRLQTGKSLQTFADAIGYDKSYVSRIESGKSTNPSLNFINCVAEAFAVSPGWLVKGGGTPALASGSMELKSDSGLEKLEETLSFVAVIRGLMSRLPAKDMLLVTNDVLNDPELTDMAKAFWFRIFTRAMFWKSDDGDPLIIKQVKLGRRSK